MRNNERLYNFERFNVMSQKCRLKMIIWKRNDGFE